MRHWPSDTDPLLMAGNVQPTPELSAVLCPDSSFHYGLCRAKLFNGLSSYIPGSLAAAQTARHRERRQHWRRLSFVVYSCWKQSQAQLYVLSTDVNTYVFVQQVSLLYWNMIVIMICLSWLAALQQLEPKNRKSCFVLCPHNVNTKMASIGF